MHASSEPQAPLYQEPLRHERALLAALLALFFLAASQFNVVHPLWEAPDEANHYAFIRHLVEQRSLPEVVPFWSDRLGGETESHQPPLYYAVQALLIGWADDGKGAEWHRNPYVTWPRHPARFAIALHRLEEQAVWQGYVLGAHLARGVSTLMGLGTVLFTFLIARRLTRSGLTALAAAALAAFTPGFAFISGSVNNDNLVSLLSAAVIWLCCGILLGDRLSVGRALQMGVLSGAAALSKLTALALLPLLAVTLAHWYWFERSHSAKRLIANAAAIAASFLAAFGWWPWLMRNDWQQIQENASNNFPAFGLLPPAGGYSLEVLRNGAVAMFTSYWGRFGWADELNLPDCTNYLIATFVAVSLVGLALTLWRGRSRLSTARGSAVLILLLFTLGQIYVMQNRYQLLPEGHIMQGRYLYAVLPLIATGLILGWQRCTGKISALLLAPVIVLMVITFAIPGYVDRQFFPPPYPVWGIEPPEVTELKAEIKFDNGITYGGPTLLPVTPSAGDSLSFENYWRVNKEPVRQFLAAFRLRQLAGTADYSDHQVPLASLLPPEHWIEGETVVDLRSIQIPTDAAPGDYLLELKLVDNQSGASITSLHFPSSEWLPLAPLRLTPQPPTGNVVRLPRPVLFGNQLQLVGYGVEESTTSAGIVLSYQLVWQAVRPPGVDYKVSLQLVDDNGALLTQHDGDPYEGRFPTSRWQVGETVPDRHHLTLTGATAAWSARVVVYEPISGQRLPVGERDYFVLPPVTP